MTKNKKSGNPVWFKNKIFQPMNCLKTKTAHKNGVSRRSCRECISIQIKKRYKNNKKYRDYNIARSKKQIGTNQKYCTRFVATLTRHWGFPKASEFKCFDCGKKAEVYDHRDYLIPEWIEPVCRVCNWKRPTAKNRSRPKYRSERKNF